MLSSQLLTIDYGGYGGRFIQNVTMLNMIVWILSGRYKQHQNGWCTRQRCADSLGAMWAMGARYGYWFCGVNCGEPSQCKGGANSNVDKVMWIVLNIIDVVTWVAPTCNTFKLTSCGEVGLIQRGQRYWLFLNAIQNQQNSFCIWSLNMCY